MEANSCRPVLTMRLTSQSPVNFPLGLVLQKPTLSPYSWEERTLHCKLCADHSSSITSVLNSYFQMRICRNYILCHCYFYSGAFYLCFSPTSLGYIALSKNPLQLFAILFLFISEGIQENKFTNLVCCSFFTDFLLLGLEFWLKTNCSNKLKLLDLFFWGLKRCLCG